MITKKYEQYGNDCIIYTTLILDDDVLIVIERVVGHWFNDEPSVSVYTENAEDKFNELVKEIENE